MDRDASSLTEQQFHTGTVALNYAEGPMSGPPFVVLHGGSGRWQYGSAFAQALSSEWHVYALDLRGHGKSGHVPGHNRIRDTTDDMGIFLREVVREPAVIYGHSHGARVGLMTAAHYPDWVRAVIAGDAGLGRPEGTQDASETADTATNAFWYALAASGQSEEEIKRALEETPITGPGEGKRAVDVLGDGNGWFDLHARSLYQLDPDFLDTYLNRVGEMFEGYEPETMFPAIRCPVLILRADPRFGSAIREEDVARARTLLPQHRVVELEGLSHLLHSGSHEPLRPLQQNVQHVLDAITPFLQNLPTASDNWT
jgi:pimeloyl-ACP methyl ester carboxylesterase